MVTMETPNDKSTTKKVEPYIENSVKKFKSKGKTAKHKRTNKYKLRKLLGTLQAKAKWHYIPQKLGKWNIPLHSLKRA